MASKQTKPSRQSLADRMHKKARISTEHTKTPALNKTPSKPNWRTKATKPQPPVSPHKRPTVSTPPPKKDVKGKAKAIIAADDEAHPSLPTSFQIIAGSYEKLLYGLSGTIGVEGTAHTYDLKPIFIFPAHMSYIRAVAASPGGGKWLATGSGDEIIKVWDLRRRKEIGGLMHHEGSITHLCFPSRSHLLSASEDGTLCLFHARDWAVLRSLKGHKGRVNSVAVHPSGKIALSVGKDRTLRMWDLMRGKGSASTKLFKEGELVQWSITGKLFVVQALAVLDVYSTDMSLLHTITHPSRIHDIKFCKRVVGEGEILLVAAEDKKVTIYDISSEPEKAPKILAEMVGHANRVKAVDTLSVALPPIPSIASGRTSTTLASTISSDGKIRVFDLALLAEKGAEGDGERPQLVAAVEYDSKGTRLTCMAMAGGEVSSEGSVVGKRKRVDLDEHEEGEEADACEDDIVGEEEDVQEEEEEEEEGEGEWEDEDEENTEADD